MKKELLNVGTEFIMILSASYVIGLISGENAGKNGLFMKDKNNTKSIAEMLKKRLKEDYRRLAKRELEMRGVLHEFDTGAAAGGQDPEGNGAAAGGQDPEGNGAAAGGQDPEGSGAAAGGQDPEQIMVGN